MRRTNLFYVLLISIFSFSLSAFAQSTARLQVIHNAADPAANVVDIYLNGSMLLDDFSFRSATPYIDAPADQQIRIDVAPASSNSAADSIRSFYFNLATGGTYVAIANGLIDPSQFSANPDNMDINFDIYAKGNMREEGTDAANVDFAVFHGSTDAPIVDVVARDVATLVNDAAYSDFTDYISVPAAKYLLDVTPGSDNETIVATFEADLSGLGGGAAVVFASGFLAPADGQAAFGIYAALPNGAVVAFPAKTTARLQVIHNAADPGAKMVDIYLNSGLLLDDFAFRAATPFIDAPANQEITISVAPPTSTSSDEAIANFPVTLMAGETYTVFANGVLDPESFVPNPDGQNTTFNLYIKAMTREMAMDTSSVEFFVFHGATDAPEVNVNARKVAELVNGLMYGMSSDYITVPADQYIIDISPKMDSTIVVATFDGAISGLKGSSAAVFASGFLRPGLNQEGAMFALYAALPDGQVVEFGTLRDARIQIIHNAADPAAGLVDIYLNGEIAVDDFAFRSATPYINIPANQIVQIAVAPGNSTSVDDAIATFPANFLAAETYIALANGVLNPTGFRANPEGRATGFKLFVKAGTREMGMSPDQVDFVVVHGSTDAPSVDVIARDVATLVDGAAYSDITDYLSVPAASYALDITPNEDNSTIVTSFNADLSGLGGGAAVVFASGFLNADAANQNGESFGLFAALPDGQVVEFSSITAIEYGTGFDAVVEQFELKQNFPNPFNPSTMISFAIPSAQEVSLKVFNVTGQEVAELAVGKLSAGKHSFTFNASQLTSGIYFYVLKAGSFREARRMTLLK